MAPEPLVADPRVLKFRTRSLFPYSSSEDEGKDDEGVDSNDPEEMFQNIQYQKEIIANIRTRPWPMRRKLKVLK